LGGGGYSDVESIVKNTIQHWNVLLHTIAYCNTSKISLHEEYVHRM